VTTKPNPQDLIRKAQRHAERHVERATGRRQQLSSSTRRELIDVARILFTEKGYAGVSLDEIVAGAKVTKGALYHHFSGKQALFEAAFEQVEIDAVKQIRKAIRKEKDPWEKALLSLRAFLQCARSEEYRRMVIQDGPAVLGYERFREQEERSSYGLVYEIVALVMTDFALPPVTVDAFARIFFGSVSAAASAVSNAEDPEVAAREIEFAISLMLTALRIQVESGAAQEAIDVVRADVDQAFETDIDS
jgi:AcrR family transcriptional regulator